MIDPIYETLQKVATMPDNCLDNFKNTAIHASLYARRETARAILSGHNTQEVKEYFNYQNKLIIDYFCLYNI